MRFLGRALLALLGVVALLVVVAYLLPRAVTVERSVTIDAPPEAVFPHVNSLQEFAQWSPWADYDPAMELVFSGPAEGVGNRMEWRSDDDRVGAGSQEITLSEPARRVETALDFDGTRANAAIALVPVTDGTRVSWTLATDMGDNPVARYMGLMMDRWVGVDYERGLQRLKATVEGG